MSEKNRPAMVFFNMGWMINYAGPSKSDPTRGTFGWLKAGKRLHGHECFNFMPRQGYCHGYHPGGFSTRLQRLGAMASDDHLDEVCVVWLAHDPRIDKTVIVGWYEHATLYRDFQLPPRTTRRSLYDHAVHYKASAREENCTLLRVDQRTFHIPRARETKGGLGQNPIWYGNNELNAKVWAYIQGNSRLTSRKQGDPTNGSGRRTLDKDLQRKIEHFAVDHAWKYYESALGGNRDVQSVETDRKGWDLEAEGTDDTLLIEVKGLSSGMLAAELTPNEYQMMRRHRSTWVLYVVTGCLSKDATAYRFRYMHDSKRWETDDGLHLEIAERVGAAVSI